MAEQHRQEQKQQEHFMVGAPTHVKEATSDVQVIKAHFVVFRRDTSSATDITTILTFVPTIQQLVDLVTPQIQSELATPFSSSDSFQAMQYSSQVVAGMIYYVKIMKTTDETCWHVKIFKPLPYTHDSPRVMGIQQCNVDDALLAF